MNTIELSTEQLVSQVKGNLVSDMNGEKVMMSIASGKYYNLGQVGGRIWEIIETPHTIGQVVDLLMEEYEIGLEECRHQVVSFLGQLHKERLVAVEG